MAELAEYITTLNDELVLERVGGTTPFAIIGYALKDRSVHIGSFVAYRLKTELG